MMKEKVKITLIYNSVVLFLIRLTILNALIILAFFHLRAGEVPKIPLFILSIFIMIEIFIRYGVGKISPRILVAENNGDKYDSFTKEALESVLYKSNAASFISTVIKYPQAKFILQKSVISKKEIQLKNVNLAEVVNEAFEIARKSKGKYVTTGDLLVSYILITEIETKLLFSKQLKEQDLININNWGKVTIHEEDPKIRKARFVGIGIGETLTYGWTPEAKKYTEDHTFSNIKKKSLVEGREKEYQMLIAAMQKPQNNNVLIVGELGTGKTNLVENFIFESYEARLSKPLNHRRFLELMVGPFISGSANRQDLETRLQAVIEEVRHSVNVVLYIPEFQNLLGSSSYSIDLSGAMLPYLKDGKMPIIGTMTKGEYKKYFENNALREVFEVIILEEPTREVALKMLFQKTDEIEKQNNAYLSYSSVISAVRYADKYEPNAVLPGTAVDLLNAASNSVKISRGKNSIVLEEDVLSAVEAKSKIPVGAPTEKEKMFLLNLENEMHKYIIGQNEAIISVSEALRRIRAGLAREKPISFLFLGPTGVGKTETAKTLARLYFGGEAKIVRLDMSEYGTPDSLPRLIQSGSGSFLDEIASHPFSLVLLDEFEKADQKILNLFLQVFDDGRMTDVAGKTVSFSNTIIIATSNAGSEFIRQSVINNTPVNNKSLLDYLQEKGIFTPELLNRFDGVVTFKPLTQGEITEVTKLVIGELSAKLAVQDIVISVDPQAIEMISRQGFNQEFGARPLRRYVQDKLEDVIAKKMLQGEIARGSNVLVSLDSTSNLVIAKQ